MILLLIYYVASSTGGAAQCPGEKEGCIINIRRAIYLLLSSYLRGKSKRLPLGKGKFIEFVPPPFSISGHQKVRERGGGEVGWGPCRAYYY